MKNRGNNKNNFQTHFGFFYFKTMTQIEPLNFEGKNPNKPYCTIFKLYVAKTQLLSSAGCKVNMNVA